MRIRVLQSSYLMFRDSSLGLRSLLRAENPFCHNFITNIHVLLPLSRNDSKYVKMSIFLHLKKSVIIFRIYLLEPSLGKRCSPVAHTLK
jgi:hypothetical protein